MYGYRPSTENALMTNLNSISSSLSSIDTIGRRTNTKASADNLIGPRSHSIASTSLLWRGPKEERHSTTASIRNGTRYAGSDIYYSHKRRNVCPNSETALTFMLVPLLLLTITRQVFDFLGQIWLQIIINFFTIILLIVALFGIRQQRISYLALFSVWALFNTVWNIIVICVHLKLRDVGINEDALSFHTGATSWWHSNGPGCLPYNISSIQPSISIFRPNIITGCRVDYHIIESFQAALHVVLSLLSSLVCCCVISNIRSYPKVGANSDKVYRMSNLTSDRSRVNPDPYPSHASSRFGANTASLRRPANAASSRSSQHSVSSMRSARRRRQSVDGTALPTPRGSTSSTQRSQKYGSISSRRSASRRDRRGEISSLTYGTTGDRGSRRTRLSSVSSTEYLPSYQPPHSSSANLLSSYGEISSIDSYTNDPNKRRARNNQTSLKTISQGNSNPTYNGSRSSVCSQNYANTNVNGNSVNNYDDLSYIYGSRSTKGQENPYSASSSNMGSHRQRQQIYQQNRINSLADKNGFKVPRAPSPMPTHSIQAETYRSDPVEGHFNGDTKTRAKGSAANGSFQSFSATNGGSSKQQQFSSETNPAEINNNHMTSNYQNFNGDPQSRAPIMTTQQIYTNNRNVRSHPIYTNQNVNSETPI